MKIDKLAIRNYKSIKKVELELKCLNVLAGKNNSGKSNIIDVFKQIKNIQLNSKHIHDIVSQRGGFEEIVYDKDLNNEIEIEMEFSLTAEERKEILISLFSKNTSIDLDEIQKTDFFKIFKYSIKFARSIDKQVISTPDLLNGDVIFVEVNSMGRGPGNYEMLTFELETTCQNLPPNSNIFSLDKRRRGEGSTLPLLSLVHNKSVRNFLGSTLYAFLQRWDWIDPQRSCAKTTSTKKQYKMASDISNLIQALDTYERNHPEIYARIEQFIKETIPEIEDLSLPILSGSTISVGIKERGFDSTFTLPNLGTGTEEILAILTRLVAAEDESVILYEEPELHLHPGVQRKLFEIMRELSEQKKLQIVMSTHSPVFANRSRADEVWLVVKDGGTTAIRLGDEDRGELLDLLGVEKSELLQYEAMVFVEGRSDRAILKRFSKRLDIDIEVLGIRLKPLEGREDIIEHGKYFATVCNELRVPYLFIIDPHTDDPMDVKQQMQQKGIPEKSVIVLNRYSIESYLVNDPEAIASIVNKPIEQIKTLLEQKKEKQNKVSVLDAIFKTFTGQKYDKERHGFLIAGKMKTENIHPDIQEIVTRFQNLVT